MFDFLIKAKTLIDTAKEYSGHGADAIAWARDKMKNELDSILADAEKALRDVSDGKVFAANPDTQAECEKLIAECEKLRAVPTGGLTADYDKWRQFAMNQIARFIEDLVKEFMGS